MNTDVNKSRMDLLQGWNSRNQISVDVIGYIPLYVSKTPNLILINFPVKKLDTVIIY